LSLRFGWKYGSAAKIDVFGASQMDLRVMVGLSLVEW
jgi:hypothetical protein